MALSEAARRHPADHPTRGASAVRRRRPRNLARLRMPSARPRGRRPPASAGAGPGLPAVVGEGLVGLRHAEDVVLALVRAALLGLRVHQLVGEPLRHGLLAPLARELDEPPDGERAGPAGGHLDRHLVGRTADAAGPDLELRREHLDGLLDVLDRIAPRALGDDRQGVVDDPLGRGLLAVQHHLVDDLLHQLGAVDGVRLDRPDGGGGPARHYFAFTPYWLRAFLRSETPAASSVPRTTLYRTPGRSFTRPPRTRTTECSWRLCPSPGM